MEIVIRHIGLGYTVFPHTSRYNLIATLVSQILALTEVKAWLKTTPEQVVDQICKLAKKGATPSQIGVVLRDSHGIPQVKVITGNIATKNLSRQKQ